MAEGARHRYSRGLSGVPEAISGRQVDGGSTNSRGEFHPGPGTLEHSACRSGHCQYRRQARPPPTPALPRRRGQGAGRRAEAPAPAPAKQPRKPPSRQGPMAFSSGRSNRAPMPPTGVGRTWTRNIPKLLAGLSPTVSPKKTASGTLYRLQVAGSPRNTRARFANT